MIARNQNGLNFIANMTHLQLFIVISACFFINAHTERPKFRRDYTYYEQFDSFIKINPKKKTWQDAKAYCDAEGASLGVIRTNAEAAEIFKKFPKDVPEMWIGVQCFLSKGDFRTIQGEPISQVFADWAPGEPNNAFGTEDCVAFNQIGKLNDQGCQAKRPFLCKANPTTVTPNTACNNFDLDYKPVLDGSKCIKFHNKPKSWREAYTMCNAEGSYLAIINSQEEADLFKNEFNKRLADSLVGNFNKNLIHLGFHDKFEEGDYMTLDGERLCDSGYENWAPGEPNNDNNEDCGSMFRVGTLNDVNCDDRALFICEKSATDVI